MIREFDQSCERGINNAGIFVLVIAEYIAIHRVAQKLLIHDLSKTAGLVFDHTEDDYVIIFLHFLHIDTQMVVISIRSDQIVFKRNDLVVIGDQIIKRLFVFHLKLAALLRVSILQISFQEHIL